jgi:3-hydroxybutyrate dehydrogenase
MNITMNQHEISAAPRLNGKVSLITGSTSGIGLGIARALAAAGSAVVLNGFGKPEEIHATQATIKSEFGVPVVYSPADVSKPASIEEMINTVLAEFGGIDILVNNAGIQHVAPLQEFPSPNGMPLSPSI